jgi:flagellin-like hook-associated protein FlgL
MRITNKVVTEKYLRSINNIQTELDRLNNQAVTLRKFTKVSEDTPAAVKAFHIRKDMKRVEGYQSSILHAQGMLTSSETSARHIQEDVLTDVRTEIIYGLNGSQSSEERSIVANKLRNLQQEILQTLNSNAAGLYYFGGSSVEQPPFSVDPTDGKLMYRYKEGANYQYAKLDDLRSEPYGLSLGDPGYDATEEDAHEASYNLYKQLMGAGLFVDIGMGIRVSDQPSTYAQDTQFIDRNSVFTYTLPGIEITGVGTRTMLDGATEVSMNLYDLIGTIADSFDDKFIDGNGTMQEYTYARTNELFGYLTGWNDPDSYTIPGDSTSPLIPGKHHEGVERHVQFSITDIGTKSAYLDFVDTRMATRQLDNTESQQETEGEDLERTLIYFEAQQLAYEAALRMGAQVIPMSIFDYIQ